MALRFWASTLIKIALKGMCPLIKKIRQIFKIAWIISPKTGTKSH